MIEESEALWGQRHARWALQHKRETGHKRFDIHDTHVTCRECDGSSWPPGAAYPKVDAYTEEL